jgi:hypothetical protein
MTGDFGDGKFKIKNKNLFEVGGKREAGFFLWGLTSSRLKMQSQRYTKTENVVLNNPVLMMNTRKNKTMII